MRWRARRCRRSLFTAVLTAMLAAGTAVAQELHVGLHGGIALPAGDFYTQPASLSTGGALGAVVNLNSTSRPWGFAASVNYSSMKSSVDSIGYAELWSIAGSVVWWPGRIGGKARPWLQAGAGGDYWAVKPVNDITIGLEAGAGVILDLGGTLLPYLESRYHLTLNEGSHLRQVLILAGIRYRL